MRLIGMGLLAAAASLDVTVGFQSAGGVRPAGGWGQLGGRRAVCSPTVVHATAPPPVATGGGGGGGSDDDKDDGGGADISRPWPAKSERSMDYSLMKGEVPVRFINAPGRYPSTGKNDIVAAAKPGDVLIQVGDSVGIDIPRGCMTGLCGSCTSDIEDPAFPGSRSVLRACSTRVVVPDGCDEMVIDLYRMQETKSKPKADPMARFSSMDDPNTGFKARWNMPETGAAAKTDCAACGAKGVNAKGQMPEDCVLGQGCPFSKF